MLRFIGGLMLAVVFAMTSVVAEADPGQGSYYFGDHPMMYGGMFMGPIMMLVIVVVLVVAVVFIIKAMGLGGTGHGHHGQNRALAILDERFAKGEIDKAEYEDRKKTLAG